MAYAKHWCFTLNNYSDDEVAVLRLLDKDEKVDYMIWGYEEAPETGTPHLQGYIAFKKRIRLTGLKKINKRIAWFAAKGSPEENKTYCSKSGSVEEFGTLPAGERNRTDLADFMNAVKGGELCKKTLRENFPDVFSKYNRFCLDYIQDNIPRPQVEGHELHDWQQDLYNRLKLPPSDREIIFVVDKDGNKGKTWFAKYYCGIHENAQMMEPAKKADMAYSLQDNLRVLFVNCTRQQVENLQYSFYEALKDGVVFSPKYESRVRYFEPVHVVILMNQDPDMNMLSRDRYNIITLN